MINITVQIAASLARVVSESIKRPSAVLLMGFAFLLGAVSLVPVSAQTPASVRLEVRTTVARVRLDGAFIAAASILNRETERPVVLRGNPGFRSDGGLRLTVTDPNRTNREIQAPRGEFAASEVPNSGRYLLLAPGERFEMLLKIPARQLFSEPGRYEVTVEYTSPLPGRLAQPSRGLEGATARSAPLVIDVLP